jgi:hypothetical protein
MGAIVFGELGIDGGWFEEAEEWRDHTLHQNEGITAPFRQRLYIKALLKVNTEPLDSPCEKGDV